MATPAEEKVVAGPLLGVAKAKEPSVSHMQRSAVNAPRSRENCADDQAMALMETGGTGAVKKEMRRMAAARSRVG